MLDYYYFDKYMIELGNYLRIALECPPNPKLQSAILIVLLYCNDFILLITLVIITG